MAPDALIIGVIAVLIVILGVVAVFALIRKKKRGEKHEVNYNAFFAAGIVFFIIGLSTDNPAFWIIGIAMFVIGMGGRQKKIVGKKKGKR